MSRSLLTFSGFFVVLSAITILVFRKYLALGINHSIYYCQSLLNSSSLHIPRELNLLIVIGGLFFLAVVLIKLVSMFLQLKLLRKKMLDEICLPKSLQLLASEISLTGKVKLINSGRPFAYCFGLRCPKIFISSALLITVSQLELKAILLHEKYHLKNRDSLTLFIGRVTENLFPFFPIISDFIRNFRIRREINADNEAIRILGSKDLIINAITKILVFGTPAVSFSPAFAEVDTLEERILVLMGKKPTRKLNLTSAILSASVFLFILGILATPIFAEEIHYDQTDAVVVCLNAHTQNFSIPASQTPH